MADCADESTPLSAAGPVDAAAVERGWRHTVRNLGPGESRWLYGYRR